MTVISWRTALSDSDRRLVIDLAAAAAAHDGIAPVGDQVFRELRNDRTGHLTAEVDGELVGYLNLVPATGADTPPMAEVVVRPDARRRGIGSELIRTGLDAGGAGTRVWAHGNLEPAKATAATLDLVAARELLQMRRRLAELPSGTAREDVLLRTYAGAADDSELLRVNNAAFAWHPEQGGWTEADIAERRGESWFDPQGLFLAFDPGNASPRLLGFHWTKVHGPALGEVYVVGVDPDAQGRGLGATLTLAGLHYLAERLGPDAEVTLYVEADNSAAVKTYRRLDFGVFSVDVAYTLR